MIGWHGLVQDALSSGALVSKFYLASTLMQQDDKESVPVTDDKLSCALFRDNASSPSDDVITFLCYACYTKFLVIFFFTSAICVL